MKLITMVKNKNRFYKIYFLKKWASPQFAVCTVLDQLYDVAVSLDAIYTRYEPISTSEIVRLRLNGKLTSNEYETLITNDNIH